MTQRRVRILLVDDHPLVRAGVRRVLETRRNLLIVGEAADGEAALEAVHRDAPDVLILDLGLPRLDGMEVLHRAKAARPELKVVVLTMHAGAEYIARAVSAGADAYLLKESAVQDLLSAIDAVLEGRAFHSQEVQAELARMVRASAAPSARPLDLLTERELEVLREVTSGRSSKEVAARLRISSRTVESHRANLMRKLGVRTVARLTLLAVREGLISPPPSRTP